MKELILQNDEATNKLGKDIANEIKLVKTSSIEIHLEGDLGAGKTFLSRSIIKSCGWKDLVKSPTYTLCEEYDLSELLFLHIDLYRSEDIEDIDLFDIDRSVDKKKVVIIEWPEKLKTKRDPDMEIFLEHKSNKREVSVKIHSQKLLETIKL